MIHRLLFILFWAFFQSLSIVNGWGGVLGYPIAPLVLAGLLSALVAGITRYADAVEDGDSVSPDS